VAFVSCKANVLSNSAPVRCGTYMSQLYLPFRQEESHTSTVRDLMKQTETMWVEYLLQRKTYGFLLPFDVVLIRQNDQRLRIQRPIFRGQDYYRSCRWKASVNYKRSVNLYLLRQYFKPVSRTSGVLFRQDHRWKSVITLWYKTKT
jgi:hypothetical protein